MKEYKKVTLETFNSGAAMDLFEEELKKVLENIADDNTKATAVREIHLIFKIQPTEDRAMAATQIESKSKLASIKPSRSAVFLGIENGKVSAYTNDMKQQELPFEQDKIISMGGES